jgi:hypothetical protein
MEVMSLLAERWRLGLQHELLSESLCKEWLLCQLILGLAEVHDELGQELGFALETTLGFGQMMITCHRG